MIVFQQDALTVFQSALFQTNSAVVEGDDCVLVSDPTWLPQEVEEIAEHVRAIRGGRRLYLLFTHSDFDHILGYGAFPDAVTIGSEQFVHNPRKEQSVEKVRAWDSEYYVCRPYEIVYPRIDIPAAGDGQQAMIGNSTRLTFYSAPGHTPDGLWTVVEPHGVLIAGDYLSDIEFPLIGESSAAYEETLHKLDGIWERHAVRFLVPGHGQGTAEGQEMRRRRQQSLDYIHALRAHITADNQAALDAMLDDYPFPKGLKAFHEANQTLMRMETALPAN